MREGHHKHHCIRATEFQVTEKPTETVLKKKKKIMNDITEKLWRNGFRQSLIRRPVVLVLIFLLSSFSRSKPISSQF